MADGPVIALAAERALAGGTNTRRFEHGERVPSERYRNTSFEGFKPGQVVKSLYE